MTSPSPPTLLERLRRRPDGGALWGRFVDLYALWLEEWLRRAAGLPEGSLDAEEVLRSILVALCREYPRLRGRARPGEFRVWLRATLVRCVREHRERHGAASGPDRVLDQLADAQSDFSRGWDEDHDPHVAARLLERGERCFPPYTWEVFRRTVLGGQPASRVAVELKASTPAVLLARSRVLAWLRRESAGLLDGLP